jgi:hypothetical protein
MNESPFEALKPDVFARDLANEINNLMADRRNAKAWPSRPSAASKNLQLKQLRTNCRFIKSTDQGEIR